MSFGFHGVFTRISLSYPDNFTAALYDGANG
jgi:hypothetical protein